jgi:hypothetical protein
VQLVQRKNKIQIPQGEHLDRIAGRIPVYNVGVREGKFVNGIDSQLKG